MITKVSYIDRIFHLCNCFYFAEKFKTFSISFKLPSFTLRNPLGRLVLRSGLAAS